MKNINLIIFFASSLAFLGACQGVKQDAKETPIGSVVSGETNDTETYVERVREKNRKEQSKRDVWRPAGTDIDSI